MARKTTARELHLKTSGIFTAVVNGETFIVEKRGLSVAEIRPLLGNPATTRMPNREKILRKLPVVRTDSGRILEKDRI